MYSKLFMKFLLAFAIILSISIQLILTKPYEVSEVKNLINEPGWGLMSNVQIVENGDVLTMKDLSEAFNDSTVADNFNTRIRQLSNMLSCEYVNYLREYASLVEEILTICEGNNEGDLQTLCVLLLTNDINVIKPMITNMISSLTYFYRVSTSAIDFKQLYIALITIQQFLEKKSNLFLDEENTIKNTNNKSQFQRWLFFVDLRVQMFAVWHCKPLPHSLRINVVNSQCQNLESNQTKNAKEKATLKCLSIAINDLRNKFIQYFDTLGFSRHTKSNDVDTLENLNAIWKFLEKQQPNSKSTRVRWFDDLKKVSDVEDEVKSQIHSTKKLATYQSLSLQAIAQMLYKRIIEYLYAKTNANNSSYDGTTPEVPTHTLKTLFQSIFTFLSQKLGHEDKNDTREILTNLLENISATFSSLMLPIETTETLETLMIHLKSKQNVDTEEIIQLLEFEMKNSGVDFAKENDINTEKSLKLLSQFNKSVLCSSEFIKHVSCSNALLLNGADYEQTDILKSSEPLYFLTQLYGCPLLIEVIEFFYMNSELLSLYSYWPKLKKSISRHLQRQLNQIIPKIIEVISIYMSSVPIPENVYLRNALVLIMIYPTIQSMRLELSERYVQSIIIQIESYAVQYCDMHTFHSTIKNVKKNPIMIYNYYFKDFYKHDYNKILTTLNNQIHEYDNKKWIVNCKIIIQNASYVKIVETKLHARNPLSSIKDLVFLWNEHYKSIKTIRRDVLDSLCPKMFATYQDLVQKSVTSILFGYLINIIQATERNNFVFTDIQIASIISKIKRFDSIVYPGSKTESPSYIFNAFIWFCEQKKVSFAVALKEKIESKIVSYGISKQNYYEVLTKRNIIWNEEFNENPMVYVQSLEKFVDESVEMFQKEFFCVANYMTLIL